MGGMTQDSGKQLNDLRISTNYTTKSGLRNKQQATFETKQDLPILNQVVSKPTQYKGFHRRGGTNTGTNSFNNTAVGVLSSKDY